MVSDCWQPWQPLPLPVALSGLFYPSASAMTQLFKLAIFLQAQFLCPQSSPANIRLLETLCYLAKSQTATQIKKKIFRFFSLGLRVYNGHSAQHAISINLSSRESTILRIKEKQKLSLQEGQQGAPRSRQPE